MNPEEFAKRELEISLAVKDFPQDEMGAAYDKWKAARGEKPVMLSTDDPTIEASKMVLRELSRPCDKCDGTQHLESVCGGCVEGRAGYKSKWTCDKCLHRELSKKEYMEWLQELSSSSKE
jgi:hypothetical protein